MKVLYLIRHAKSSWDNDLLTDFERPLNERGKKDAPRMAKRLKEKEITPDLMISSPAKRAIKTCKAFAEILGYSKSAIKEEQKLYHASPETIGSVIQATRDKFDTVLIFGHNPGLTEFAEWLTGENLVNVPTCGVVGVKLKIKTWKELSRDKSSMILYDFPKKHLRRDGLDS